MRGCLAALALLLCAAWTGGAAGAGAYARRAALDGEICAQGTGIIDIDIVVCTRALRGGGFEGVSRATLHTALGRAYRRKGRPDKALTEHDRALELNPASAVAWHERGLDHLALGDVAAAREDLGEALALFPNFGAALRDRGRVAFVSDDPVAALADLNAAVALLPGSAEVLAFRGLVRFQLARLDLAEADFARARLGHLGYPYLAVWHALAAARTAEGGSLRGARDILHRALEELREDEWPAALLRALLTQKHPSELRDELAALDARLRSRRRYESAFYLGMWAALSGDEVAAKDRLALVRRDAPPRSVEAVMARAVLGRAHGND
jgi:tetratricopeptide (TPR) repeat protein